MNRTVSRRVAVGALVLVPLLFQATPAGARWRSISDLAHNVRQVCKDGISFELGAGERGETDQLPLTDPGDNVSPVRFIAESPPGSGTIVADQTLVIPFNPINPASETPRLYHGFYTIRWRATLPVGSEIDITIVDAFGDENPWSPTPVVQDCRLRDLVDESLRASLGGSSGGDPNGSGLAKISLDPGAGRVCFELSWADVGRPTKAHIHTNVNGAALVDLLSSASSFQHRNGSGSADGCVTGLAKALIRDIGLHPGGFYVDIHSKAFPNGAIRGNLRG